MLADVVGQDEGVRFLRKVADRQYISPLLLVGDVGVGRKYAVLQTAKEIFCTGSREAACGCYSCLLINEGTHPDFTVLSPPADKEIKVDEIRTVIEGSYTFPSMAPLRLFLIDGADQMTNEAANALLKTIEEPHNITRFFLSAQKESRVLPTVRSRCGLVRFRQLPERFVLDHLTRNVPGLDEDSNKALVYARMGEGSVGRAVQYAGSSKIGLRDKMFSLITAGVRRDLPSIFSVSASVGQDSVKGSTAKELNVGLRFLDQIVHDLLIVRHDPGRMINLDIADAIKQTREKMSDDSWSKLSNGLKSLTALNDSVAIDLLFHVQALFVDSFLV